MQNIFFQYLIWHLIDAPKGIIQAWKNYLRFNLNYFSVVLLFKTLFAPWRKYRASYGRGFDFVRYLEAFLSNLIFRLFGATIRSFLILIGLSIEIIIFIAGATVLLIWLISPLLLILAIYHGFRILI